MSLLITLDQPDGIFVSGTFIDSDDFDLGLGEETLFTSQNSADSFIAKIDINGQLLWVKLIRGDRRVNVQAIGCDLLSNVYIFGELFGTADFDPGLDVFELTGDSLDKAFIMKLNAQGSFQWAQQFGGTGHIAGFAMEIDLDGNVFTSGFFRRTADFDGSSEIFNLTSTGHDDGFINK